MPAPSLESLYLIEDYITSACIEILSLKLGDFKLNPPADQAEVAWPRATVSVIREGVTGAMALLANGCQEHSQYTVSVRLMLQVRREDNEAATEDGVRRRLSPIAAKAAVALMVSRAPFQGLLQYHAVSDILPGAVQYGIDDRDSLDTCLMQWRMTVDILDEAWPDPLE